MTPLKCPKCDEQVRLPDASAQARVQCPLCAEEFELAEALDRLAPMLVVLHDPGASRAAAAGPKNTFSGTDLVAEAESDAGAPDFSFDAPSDEPKAAPAFAFEDGTTSATSSSTSARRARSQRPQKSAIKEMAKVVGGGVIGLTIGQLILWWLPGNLKRDPLELGPKVPAFASFLVSPQFRGTSVAQEDLKTTKNIGSAVSTDFGGFGANLGSELPSSSFEGLDDPNDNQGDKKKKNKQNSSGKNGSSGPDETTEKAGDSSFDPLAPLPTETEDDIFGAKPELDVPMINLNSFPTATDTTEKPKTGESGDTVPTISPPAVEPPAVDPTTPTVATGDFIGVRNAPTISVDQLSTRLSGAVSASIAMDTSSTEPVPKQLTLAKEFYTTLAGLGEAITFVDQKTATDQVNEVGKFALEVGKQSGKLDLIGKVAPSWMKNSRPHNGIVVFGTVESMEFTEPYFVTSLVMPNNNKVVLKVVSMNDPSGDYQPQNKILVLGSILDAPQQNLKDYQGEATTIVLDGLHATLPDNE